MFSSFLTAAFALPIPSIPIAAQGTATNSASWAIVIFAVVVGVIVTLKSSRRTTEVKRPKNE